MQSTVLMDVQSVPHSHFVVVRYNDLMLFFFADAILRFVSHLEIRSSCPLAVARMLLLAVHSADGSPCSVTQLNVAEQHDLSVAFICCRPALP